MLVIKSRNVNGAWATAVQHLGHVGTGEWSRAGDVLVYPEPVTTVYARPWERVLFCERRDANPFFHLFESMWMIAGESDARWLDRYVHDFSERFAEENGHVHGAYGRRWRYHFMIDQISVIVRLLRSEPTTRRAVLTMWDPSADLGVEARDMPCNTHVYFRYQQATGCLDMTVCCRSNDAVWGCYGANAVHLSVLHEFVAAAAEMHQGSYTQVSNNFHAYKDILDKMFPGDKPGHRWEVQDCDRYRTESVKASPLFQPGWSPNLLRAKLLRWMQDPSYNPDSDFPELFDQLLVPMSRTHDLCKRRDYHGALLSLQSVVPSDWRGACRMWINRRLRRQAANVLESDDDSLLLLSEKVGDTQCADAGAEVSTETGPGLEPTAGAKLAAD